MAEVDILLPPRTPDTPVGSSEYGKYDDELDVQLGDEILTSGFAQHLHRYYPKASPEDQNTCLKLLNRLQAAGSRKETQKLKIQRPKTAMASLGRTTPSKHNHPLDPFRTTYVKEYPEKGPLDTTAERPMTSQLVASYDLDGPIGNTTYDQEYHKKSERPAKAVRSGSSTGNRRNNPHPLQSFTVWKFPREGKSQSHLGQPLTDDLLDKVLRGQLRSTYQNDYIGVPQGYTVKNYYNIPGSKDWKADIPYTLDSLQRASYQHPSQHPTLKNNTTRFGCTGDRQMPAYGTVPTSNPIYMNKKTKTHYVSEYCEKAPGNMQSTGLGIESVEDIPTGRFSCRPGSVSGSRYGRPRIPSATSFSYTEPKWVSTWVGPQ